MEGEDGEDGYIFADEVFLITAITLYKDIDNIPVHKESATIREPGTSIYKVSDRFQCNRDDGPLTRQEPLCLLYLEEWWF